jgi:hypothetical protein
VECLDRDVVDQALPASDWNENETVRALGRDALRRALVQIEMVSEFARFADELGYPIGGELPLNAYDTWQAGRLPTPSSDPLRGSQALALAQHHGIPTFLLDWTWQPLVAAYFASQLDPDETPAHIGVFAIDTSKLRSLGRYQCPRHQMEFLHAQHGLFLHQFQPFNTYHSMKKWAPFDQVDERIQVVCLKLPGSEAATLRDLLSLEQITRAHLMPTLDNVAATLKQRWQG